MSGRVLGLALIALSLAGCITNDYTRAHEARKQDAEFMRAYTACSSDTAAFGLIPDLGFTRDAKFFRCMEKAGWIQEPRWNPAALGRYQRIR